MSDKSGFQKSYSAHFEMERDIVAEFNRYEQIFIKNPEVVRVKLEAMRKDGKSKLNIFTDFDYTLTRKTCQYGKADNSHKAIENVVGAKP